LSASARRSRAPLLLLGFAVAIWRVAAADPSSHTLKLASWNLEWLIAPLEFKQLQQTCAPRGIVIAANERRIPCDVATRLWRAQRDFEALARYARTLDADVVGIQEVDGPSAAALVFPDYEFCFTGRAHPQNNGFAVRRGIAHRCGPDLRELGLHDTLRRGAELVLFPGEPREMHLLSVHLKSGCSAAPLDSPDKACAELAQQVPLLEAWIDRQAAAGHRFAVLGDFNRDLLAEQGPARAPSGKLVRMWPELDDGKPPEAELVNTARGERFRNCIPGQSFAGYIDFIVLSRGLGAALLPGSFERTLYSAVDARHTRLSDHCPVAVRVRI
jgi:endonuclease/exonuclease/phosphatase family metal-dependent hydrolase